jgi:hypothetical protein
MPKHTDRGAIELLGLWYKSTVLVWNNWTLKNKGLPLNDLDTEKKEMIVMN